MIWEPEEGRRVRGLPDGHSISVSSIFRVPDEWSFFVSIEVGLTDQLSEDEADELTDSEDFEGENYFQLSLSGASATEEGARVAAEAAYRRALAAVNALVSAALESLKSAAAEKLRGR